MRVYQYNLIKYELTSIVHNRWIFSVVGDKLFCQTVSPLMQLMEVVCTWPRTARLYVEHEVNIKPFTKLSLGQWVIQWTKWTDYSDSNSPVNLYLHLNWFNVLHHKFGNISVDTTAKQAYLDTLPVPLAQAIKDNNEKINRMIVFASLPRKTTTCWKTDHTKLVISTHVIQA